MNLLDLGPIMFENWYSSYIAAGRTSVCVHRKNNTGCGSVMCMQTRNDISDNAWHWLLGVKWHSLKLKEAIPGRGRMQFSRNHLGKLESANTY